MTEKVTLKNIFIDTVSNSAEKKSVDKTSETVESSVMSNLKSLSDDNKNQKLKFLGDFSLSSQKSKYPMLYVDKFTGLTKNLDETDEEYEIRLAFEYYARSQGALANVADDFKNTFKTETSSNSVRNKLQKLLSEHDIEGAKQLIVDYAETQKDTERGLAQSLAFLLGGSVIGAGALVSGAIALLTTISLECAGKENVSKDDAKDALKDGIVTGSCTALATGLIGVNEIGATSTAVKNPVKNIFVNKVASYATEGFIYGVGEVAITDGIDIATGQKLLTKEQLDESAVEMLKNGAFYGALDAFLGIFFAVPEALSFAKEKKVVEKNLSSYCNVIEKRLEQELRAGHTLTKDELKALENVLDSESFMVLMLEDGFLRTSKSLKNQVKNIYKQVKQITANQS